MKRVFSVLCILSLVTCMIFGLSACGQDPLANAKYKIGILRCGSSSVSQDMINGYKDAINAHYEQGSIGYIEKNASTPEQLEGMIRELESEGVAAIAAFGDDAAKAAVAKNPSVPVFFVGVSNAITLGLTGNVESPDKNATGAQISIPAYPLVKESQNLTEISSYGVIYYSAGTNQEATDVITAISRTDATFELKGITSPEEALAAAKELAETQDAFVLTGEETVNAAADGIIAIADEKRIPVFAFKEETVAKGAVLGVTVSDYELGKAVGEYTDQVLNGTAVNSLPVITTAPATQICVNTAKAAQLGYTIPDELLKNAKHVGQ